MLAVLAGAVTGVLSGWGVGGGTLLLLYLTVFTHMEQSAAQGINLLYFLPCAGAALIAHIKNRLVDVPCALWAAGAGLICALGASFLATAVDTALLRKIFGGFLLAVGFWELLGKQPEK